MSGPVPIPSGLVLVGLVTSGLAAFGPVPAAMAQAPPPAEDNAQDAMLAEPLAPADAVDEVVLKGGGFVRGLVTRMEPGTMVELVEVGRRAPRTIPWSDVADVHRGKYASGGLGVAPSSEPAAPAPGPSPGAVPQTGVVPPGPHGYGGQTTPQPGFLLHIETPEPVVLNRVVGSSYTYAYGGAAAVTHSESVCSSPCDRIVEPIGGREFYVTGDGVPASEPFSMANIQGDTTLVVEPGSVGMKIGGSLALYPGILGLSWGVSALVASSVIDTESDDSSASAAEAIRTSGIIAGVAGTALVIGGITLLVVSNTDVSLRPTQTSGAGSKPTARAPNYLLGEF